MFISVAQISRNAQWLLRNLASTFGNDELRRAVEPGPLQVEQQISPVVRSLAGAVGEAYQFLAAFRRRADQRQDATAARRARRTK